MICPEVCRSFCLPFARDAGHPSCFCPDHIALSTSFLLPLVKNSRSIDLFFCSPPKSRAFPSSPIEGSPAAFAYIRNLVPPSSTSQRFVPDVPSNDSSYPSEQVSLHDLRNKSSFDDPSDRPLAAIGLRLPPSFSSFLPLRLQKRFNLSSFPEPFRN